MEIPEYKNIFVSEEWHFYYRANHQIILDLARKYSERSPAINLKILDAGCGTGLLAKKMGELGKVVGVDRSDHAIKYAKSRGINVKKASILNLPFQASAFDLVTSIDVLYHLQVTDDKKALKEFYRVLYPGGIAIIRVPAHDWLRRSCDRHIHTRQRYNLLDLKNKLQDAGFKVEKISYVNALLFLPAVASFVLEKITSDNSPKSPLSKIPKIINNIVTFLLGLELKVLLKINLPFGLGIIAVSRKMIL